MVAWHKDCLRFAEVDSARFWRVKKVGKLKRIICFSVLVAGCLTAEQLNGWLTDQKCAAAGKYTGEAHKKCVEGGQPVVFVNAADKKVYMVQNQDKVKEFVGEKVAVTGTTKGDSIEVESVEPQTASQGQ